MTPRELITGVGWLLCAWGLGFTLDLIARADVVTSPQWRYLMSVPGGHWAWVSVFLSGAMALIFGLASGHRLPVAFGYSLLALGCGFIAAFYVVAPFVDPGLTTLGYWPWLLGAAVMLILAVIYARPRPWL